MITPIMTKITKDCKRCPYFNSNDRQDCPRMHCIKDEYIDAENMTFDELLAYHKAKEDEAYMKDLEEKKLVTPRIIKEYEATMKHLVEKKLVTPRLVEEYEARMKYWEKKKHGLQN